MIAGPIEDPDTNANPTDADVAAPTVAYAVVAIVCSVSIFSISPFFFTSISYVGCSIGSLLRPVTSERWMEVRESFII